MAEFENDLPPVLESKTVHAELPPPVSSLFARLLNMLAIPGHVFDEVRASRHSVLNWLVPAPLFAVSFALFTVVMSAAPSSQKLWTEQMARMRATQAAELTTKVAAGKATQADAEKTLAMADLLATPRALQVIGLAGGLGFGLVRVFWWAFVLWLLGRVVFKMPIQYCKALEVAGLASVVAMIGNLLLIALLMNVGESFSTGSFSLVVADVGSGPHQLLVALAQNGANFWLVAVLGAGLARLTGLPWTRGAFLVAAYWLASEFLLMALGVGFMR